MSDSYDVKISVMSTVKLLPEIKGLLLMKPNRKRLFMDTVFGLWLDIQSHENDSHMIHYVLQHQVFEWLIGEIFGKGEMSPEDMRHAWFMASVDFIQGLADQDGVDETICQKINRVSVEEGDGVLDSEGDGVYLSQTNDVIQQAVNLSTMSSTSPQARNVVVVEFFVELDALKKQVLLIKKRKDDEFDELIKRFSKLETSETFVMFKSSLKTNVCTENQSTDFNPKESEEVPNFCSDHNDTSNHIGGVYTEAKQPSSTSSHPENDEDASHLDDLMEIDGENANDCYSNSQHHLHLLIKALDSKTENPTIDVVVPPKYDDRILRTIKPNDVCDEVEVGNFEDDYMLRVKVEEKPSLGRGLGPLKVKKKNCQRALRPNYVLRSAQVRKKKLAMALKPPFGQQSATTSAPKKIKSRITKTKVIVPPFILEDLSRPDDCKSDKVTVPEYMSEFITTRICQSIGFLGANETLLLYRNLPVTVDDPLEIALTYRERMIEYFWNHKIQVERTSSVV
ncbi:hypothetical protein Tco_0327601 [Tanacetum coccineum]